MIDGDLMTLIEPLRSLGNRPVELDLSRNGFSDACMKLFLSELTCNLSTLDISYCGAGREAMEAMAFRMHEGWTRLQVLRIAGVKVSDSAWGKLCDSFVEHSNLTTLDISETGLGHMSEKPVEKIMR